MFNQLLESKKQRQRRAGGAFLSVVVHTVLISLAVYATARAAQEKLEKPKAEKVTFAEIKKEPPPPPKQPPPPPQVTVAPPPPKGFQVLTAPVKIPDVIPDIDLSKHVTDEADFSGKGVAGGVARGVAGGTGPVTDQPYFEFQVEKQAIAAPNNPSPKYPEVLRTAGVSGEVLVQFVVDTSGRAEMNSFKVLKSSHELFTIAVKNVLSQMRFLPAEIGGHKVRQLVQMPFEFSVGQ